LGIFFSSKFKKKIRNKKWKTKGGPTRRDRGGNEENTETVPDIASPAYMPLFRLLAPRISLCWFVAKSRVKTSVSMVRAVLTSISKTMNKGKHGALFAEQPQRQPRCCI
jgi:hypothetical protein